MLCKNCGANLCVVGHFEIGRYITGRRLKCKKCGMYYYSEERIVTERREKRQGRRIHPEPKGGETE